MRKKNSYTSYFSSKQSMHNLKEKKQFYAPENCLDTPPPPPIKDRPLILSTITRMIVSGVECKMILVKSPAVSCHV